MFEDLINTKKPRDKITLCPFCGTNLISRYNINYTTNNSREQKAYCNKCYKSWLIVYNRYMTRYEIKLPEEK